ncbi:MAG: hypothetical protein R3B48_00715 [Kofleriaceae bacterium]
MNFLVSIASLDDGTIVKAQYNPKELQIDRSVPWTKHANKNTDGGLQLEFSGADGRGVSLELFFDESESPSGSVLGSIELLEKLAKIRVPGSSKDEEKRPHHCILVFGAVYSKPFKCVIESLSTKFTMFSPAGLPIRATVNLKLKEADSVMMKKESSGSGTSGGSPGTGN